jgi:uncharacterized surface protein with fasciclin (FAS1) repeats
MTETTSTDQLGDIVAVATGAGSFGTLVAAVAAAGLVETPSGCWTVHGFCPD